MPRATEARAPPIPAVSAAAEKLWDRCSTRRSSLMRGGASCQCGTPVAAVLRWSRYCAWLAA